jgi:hypothetical protein
MSESATAIKEIHLIGGIQVHVYKDSESNIQPRSVAILFLLHGRTQSAKDVDFIAKSFLGKNNQQQQQRKLWIVLLVKSFCIIVDHSQKY